MCKVSIIIPHKNIPTLLERCINSIPPHDDIQIIVVDDNSSKEIVDFERFPGKDRANVEVIYSKRSLGGGGARNIGLNAAKGKWLMFADADDFFHDNLLDFIDGHYDSDADMIVFDTDSVMSNTLEKVEKREGLVEKYLRDNDENVLRYLHHSVWGKFFRLETIIGNGIVFQEVAASNDALFAAKVGYYARHVLFEPDILYCCTVRQGSICTRLSLENVQARIQVVYSVNGFLSGHGVDKKYWMNQLGPLFNLRGISVPLFTHAFSKYLIKTPLRRIIYDIQESGIRLCRRALGKINDKDIKMLQKKNI